MGKLPLPVPVDQLIAPLKRASAVRVVPLTESAVLRLRSLPDVHRDPFDRMIVCQALDGGYTIVTPDGMKLHPWKGWYQEGPLKGPCASMAAAGLDR